MKLGPALKPWGDIVLESSIMTAAQWLQLSPTALLYKANKPKAFELIKWIYTNTSFMLPKYFRLPQLAQNFNTLVQVMTNAISVTSSENPPHKGRWTKDAPRVQFPLSWFEPPLSRKHFELLIIIFFFCIAKKTKAAKWRCQVSAGARTISMDFIGTGHYW